jgi:DNA (cytosine-5)-methyltransferase 1
LAPNLEYMMKLETPFRTSLRLTLSQQRAIDKLCRQYGGKVKMSSWISEAIDEKIMREEAMPKFHVNDDYSARYHFYEFFAGGGMVRAGLSREWNCLFANDFDPMKARAYRDNWDGGKDLLVEDINKVSSKNLPGTPDLSWASFPCQDLSLAGNYIGIGHCEDKTQTRSGTFWSFWKLMRELAKENRDPKLIILENVYGVLTSNNGKDFAAIGSAFSEAGYQFGAMVIDAKYFVPHSRPRVFIIGVRNGLKIPKELISNKPLQQWHPSRIEKAHRDLSESVKKCWVWWNLIRPAPREKNFVDLIEENPTGVKWDDEIQTKKLLAMMSEANKKKVLKAKKMGRLVVGGLYKRTRKDESGEKIQRAEVRFDDIAGCLRTPAGGSSRQHVLIVNGNKIRSRLLSPREAARLMGLPDEYKLPPNYNDAYHIAGDGVAVPVVRHLSKHIIEPIVDANREVILASKRIAL